MTLRAYSGMGERRRRPASGNSSLAGRKSLERHRANTVRGRIVVTRSDLCLTCHLAKPCKQKRDLRAVLNSDGRVHADGFARTY